MKSCLIFLLLPDKEIALEILIKLLEDIRKLAKRLYWLLSFFPRDKNFRSDVGSAEEAIESMRLANLTVATLNVLNVTDDVLLEVAMARNVLNATDIWFNEDDANIAVFLSLYGEESDFLLVDILSFSLQRLVEAKKNVSDLQQPPGDSVLMIIFIVIAIISVLGLCGSVIFVILGARRDKRREEEESEASYEEEVLSELDFEEDEDGLAILPVAGKLWSSHQTAVFICKYPIQALVVI